MQKLKLFKVLIGCTPVGRHTEQHDIFFGIANSLQALVPQLKEFWPEAAHKMHIDAFREVTVVDDHNITVVSKDENVTNDVQLFFINLGGYKPNEFEEFHYKMVVVAPNKASAIQQAKQTTFFKHTGFAGANAHIDDKYGIDVDDIFAIEDILTADLKAKYKIKITKNSTTMLEDKLHLGYFKLSKIEKGIIETD
jgi:hypothetical protein